VVVAFLASPSIAVLLEKVDIDPILQIPGFFENPGICQEPWDLKDRV
jgi:hypothetical protein